jgi:hypothetical protein
MVPNDEDVHDALAEDTQQNSTNADNIPPPSLRTPNAGRAKIRAGVFSFW